MTASTPPSNSAADVRARFLANLRGTPAAEPKHRLDHPDFDPPDCPDWARETLPAGMEAFRGRNGQPAPYCDRTVPLAMTVRGVDRYHANQFIVYRPETAEFLYKEYTPLVVEKRAGLLPEIEALALSVTKECRSDTERAVALLLHGASRVRHPDAAPRGPWTGPDRNASDTSLLQSGTGWCNEQARVFIRLCQVSGIPARIIHLFYSDERTGHCIAEFYADGRWGMADVTWQCVFPDQEGRLLSAAACHDGGEGQARCGEAYFRRWQELLACSNEELNLESSEKTAEWRTQLASETPESLAAKHYYFSVINYPLPPESNKNSSPEKSS